MFKVFINVHFKNDIPNPVNNLAENHIRKFKKLNIKNLKIGKAIKFKISSKNMNQKILEQKIESLCAHFFTNSVIEKYKYYIKKI